MNPSRRDLLAGGGAALVTGLAGDAGTESSVARGTFARFEQAPGENGEGAVQSGHSYVRTFETTGTHEYYCIPHEAAGMAGKVIVE